MSLDRHMWEAAPEFRLSPASEDCYRLGRKAEFRPGVSAVTYEPIAHCKSIEDARARIAEFQRATIYLNWDGDIVLWGTPATITREAPRRIE